MHFPGLRDAYGLPVTSVIGKASMSARKPTVEPSPLPPDYADDTGAADARDDFVAAEFPSRSATNAAV
jgi:hypothetical protein